MSSASLDTRGCGRGHASEPNVDCTLNRGLDLPG